MPHLSTVRPRTGDEPPRRGERLSRRSGRLSRRSGRLSRRSERLSRRSGRLSRRSERLSRRSERLSRRSGRLSRRSGRLSQRSGRLSRRSGRVSRRSGRLSHRRKRVSRRQGSVSRRSGRLSHRSGRISRKQGRFSRRWGRLSRRWGRLWRRSERASRRWGRLSRRSERASRVVTGKGSPPRNAHEPSSGDGDGEPWAFFLPRRYTAHGRHKRSPFRDGSPSPTLRSHGDAESSPDVHCTGGWADRGAPVAAGCRQEAAKSAAAAAAASSAAAASYKPNYKLFFAARGCHAASFFAASLGQLPLFAAAFFAFEGCRFLLRRWLPFSWLKPLTSSAAAPAGTPARRGSRPRNQSCVRRIRLRRARPRRGHRPSQPTWRSTDARQSSRTHGVHLAAIDPHGGMTRRYPTERCSRQSASNAGTLADACGAMADVAPHPPPLPPLFKLVASARSR